MRIWSICPSYLDAKGLVALWRETLLAKKVLEGKTLGYKNHSQLIRFKQTENPIDYINFYLYQVFLEAGKRNYSFSKEKFDYNIRLKKLKKIFVNDKQINFEFSHLLSKLNQRDKKKFLQLKKVNSENILIHSLFEKKKGEIEVWEKIN